MPFGGLTSVILILIAMFGLASSSSSARGALVWARYVGFSHGVIQAGVFLAARVFGNLAVRATTAGLGGLSSTVVAWLTLIGAGALAAVGSIVVLGSYLRFANRHFRMHDNESYSARHSGDNRHFARFRITPDGTLECFVVAIRRTGSDWVSSLRADRPGPPSDMSPPELINVGFRVEPRVSRESTT